MGAGLDGMREALREGKIGLAGHVGEAKIPQEALLALRRKALIPEVFCSDQAVLAFLDAFNGRITRAVGRYNSSHIKDPKVDKPVNSTELRDLGEDFEDIASMFLDHGILLRAEEFFNAVLYNDPVYWEKFFTSKEFYWISDAPSLLKRVLTRAGAEPQERIQMAMKEVLAIVIRDPAKSDVFRLLRKQAILHGPGAQLE